MKVFDMKKLSWRMFSNHVHHSLLYSQLLNYPAEWWLQQSNRTAKSSKRLQWWF